MGPHKPVYFEPSDFTPEEIARNNLIARLVVKEGKKLCRVCGLPPHAHHTFDTWAALSPKAIVTRAVEKSQNRDYYIVADWPIISTHVRRKHTQNLK